MFNVNTFNGKDSMIYLAEVLLEENATRKGALKATTDALRHISQDEFY